MENLDRQGSSANLGHGHIRGQESNLSGPMDFLGPIGSNANDFFSESQRIIIENILGQPDLEKKSLIHGLKTDRGVGLSQSRSLDLSASAIPLKRREDLAKSWPNENPY
jgi:hypothetical protein